MTAKVEYANFRSRLILGRSFRLQYALPKREPFPPVVRFFQWYERNVLKVDTSDITVDRPIFLIGLPRSGTTMLQDIICARPDIAYITNSMHQYRSCFCAVEHIRKGLGLDFRGERFLGDSVEVGPGSPNEGHMFYADWAGIDPYSLEPSELNIENFTPEQLEQGNEILRRVIWCFGGKARFFNKNPGHLTSILFMKDMHPDAKIIHIIRDPRKCANSMLKLYRKSKEQEAKVNAVLGIDDKETREFIPYPRLPRLKEYINTYGADDLRTTANVWNDAISYVDERKAQVPFYHEVRYEDILANPKVEISRILEFCELPPVSGEKASEFEAKLNSVGVVEHRNKYGDFGIIEEICGDNMRKYGYL